MQSGEYGNIVFRANRKWRKVPMPAVDVSSITAEEDNKRRGVILDRVARRDNHAALYTLQLRQLYREELQVQRNADVVIELPSTRSLFQVQSNARVRDTPARRRILDRRQRAGGEAYMRMLEQFNNVHVSFGHEYDAIDLNVHRTNSPRPYREFYGEVKLSNTPGLGQSVYDAWTAAGTIDYEEFPVASEKPIIINWTNPWQRKVHAVWVYVVHRDRCFVTYYPHGGSSADEKTEKPAFIL